AAGLVGIHAAPQETIYHPKLTVPETLEPFLKYLEPGSDAFASERDVTELDAQLAALGDLLRNGKAAGVSERLLAPDFRGGRLLDAQSTTGNGAFDVVRSKPASDLSLDARRFGAELQRLVGDIK